MGAFPLYTYNYRRSFFDNSFKITIDTSKDVGDSFTLPLRSGFDYDFTVYWGDGNSSVITSWDDADKTHTYASGGIYEVEMAGDLESWYFNNGTDALKLISVDNWGDVGFTAFDRAFYGCSNLTSLPESDGKFLSGITDMQSSFLLCSNLIDVNSANWDVSSVIGFSQTFQSCTNLTTIDVSNWDVSACQSLSSMFQSCTSLTTIDVSNWDVSSVLTAQSFIRSCTSLTTIDVSNWDVSACNNFATFAVFATSLTTIDVSNWDVSSGTNFNGTFWFCSSLTSLSVGGWDVSSGTNFANFLTNTPLDTTSYDALLNGWSLLTLQSSQTLDAPLCFYTGSAAANRQSIIDDYTWTINDAGQVASFIFTASVTASDELDLPLVSGGSYNFTVDWGDGSPVSTITAWDDPDKTHTFTTTETVTIIISGTCTRLVFYNSDYESKLLTIQNWGSTGITSCNQMFRDCVNLTSINDPDSTWSSSVTDMLQMFTGATAFNSPISWDGSSVTTVESMFNGATSFNSTVVLTSASPTFVGSMFRGATSFNKSFSIDLSNATSTVNMFRDATVFNSSLTLNMSTITSTEFMFDGATSFNQDISGWDISDVINARNMFDGATSFDQDLGDWKPTSLTNGTDMFNGVTLSTSNYSSLLIGWEGESVQNNITFSGGNSEYSVSAITARQNLIDDHSWTITDGGLEGGVFAFNASVTASDELDLPLVSGGSYNFIVDWGDGSPASTVTSFSDTDKTHTFTTTETVTITISGTCSQLRFYNSDYESKLTSIESWGSTGITDCTDMFRSCENFTAINDSTGTWSASVTTMLRMFFDCTGLTTLNLNTWDVSSVTDFGFVFYNCNSVTTLTISSWDVSSGTSFLGTFFNCLGLTSLSISSWDVSSGTDFSTTFLQCRNLTTLDVSSWDVSSGTTFQSTFADCDSLTSLSVGGWDVSSGTNFTGFLTDVPLDTTSYDALLIGWEALTLQSSQTLDANLCNYTSAASTERASIISTYSWTINDAGLA